MNNSGSFRQSCPTSPMGYGIVAINASPTIKNNILVGNALGGIKVSNEVGQPSAFTFNDVWNNGPAGAANLWEGKTYAARR